MYKIILMLGLLSMSACTTAEVTRYPLPGGSTFPIAQAVEVSAGTILIFHSGTVPRPANAEAERGSRAYWGDTQVQAESVFARMEASLTNIGLDFGDVIKMTVYLVGVPENGGHMDFQGFMKAYTQHFGTDAQPNLPARSAVQVADLAGPGMLVEVDMVLARPTAP